MKTEDAGFANAKVLYSVFAAISGTSSSVFRNLIHFIAERSQACSVFLAIPERW